MPIRPMKVIVQGVRKECMAAQSVGLTTAPGVHVLDVNVVWNPCH